MHMNDDFFFRILSILTHTQGERRQGFKESNSGVYPKGHNSWIHNTEWWIVMVILMLVWVIKYIWY